jgi:Tripartite tricarboxylate transporter family receptor
MVGCGVSWSNPHGAIGILHVLAALAAGGSFDVQARLMAEQISRAQGVTRDETLPNVPTVDESGYKDYDADNSSGLVAPAKTPKPRKSLPSSQAGSPRHLGRLRSKRSSWPWDFIQSGSAVPILAITSAENMTNTVALFAPRTSRRSEARRPQWVLVVRKRNPIWS